MKTRIKALRLKKDLTQAEFGNKIGVKGNTIAGYENGSRSVSDSVILSVCREFGVNEAWLRAGEGEMFAQQSSEDEINFLVAKYGLSETDRIILERFVKLDKESREAVINFLGVLIKEVHAQQEESEIEKELEEDVKNYREKRRKEIIKEKREEKEEKLLRSISENVS